MELDYTTKIICKFCRNVVDEFSLIDSIEQEFYVCEACGTETKLLESKERVVLKQPLNFMRYGALLGLLGFTCIYFLNGLVFIIFGLFALASLFVLLSAFRYNIYPTFFGPGLCYLNSESTGPVSYLLAMISSIVCFLFFLFFSFGFVSNLREYILG